MLYGFLVRSNNSWFQQLVSSDFSSHLGKLCYYYFIQQRTKLATTLWWILAQLRGTCASRGLTKLKVSCCLSANRPTNFYVGVVQQSSEPTFLVQYLLANLTGSVVNVTQDNCVNQREDEEDKESKHVRFGFEERNMNPWTESSQISLTNSNFSVTRTSLTSNHSPPPHPHPMPPSFRSITTCGFKAPLLPTVRSGRVTAYAPQCVSPKRCPRRSTCGSSPPKIFQRGPSPGGRASRGAYSWWPVTTWRCVTWDMLKPCTSAHPSCFAPLRFTFLC